MIELNIFSTLIDWYMSNMNYFTIYLLMTIESTFIPLPSELVLPPAAWLAAQGDLNIFLIVLFSTLGCVTGALINYTLSFYLGRAIIYGLADSKYARIFFINRTKLEKAEKYFIDNGNTSTFVGRLVPGIRHLISIPAGLAKMDLKKFVFYTIFGSALWNTILSLIGYYFGKNQDLVMYYFHEFKWVAYGLGAVFVLYLVLKGITKKKKSTELK
jgi:membrane protein DedA with SNARE-associated domain